MGPSDLTKLSVFLCGVLRHYPERIGVELDDECWADVDQLIRQVNAHGWNLDREILTKIVESDNKKRYSLDWPNSRIRCVQGHSVGHAKVNFVKAIPPIVLYHGTVDRNCPSILKSGLLAEKRHHVHLSADIDTALDVGGRRKRAKVVVFEVDCKSMVADQLPFYQAENEVWLCDNVPPKYLSLMPDQITDGSMVER